MKKINSNCLLNIPVAASQSCVAVGGPVGSNVKLSEEQGMDSLKNLMPCVCRGRQRVEGHSRPYYCPPHQGHSQGGHPSLSLASS